jgi:hypothetical protein
VRLAIALREWKVGSESVERLGLQTPSYGCPARGGQKARPLPRATGDGKRSPKAHHAPRSNPGDRISLHPSRHRWCLRHMHPEAVSEGVPLRSLGQPADGGAVPAPAGRRCDPGADVARGFNPRAYARFRGRIPASGAPAPRSSACDAAVAQWVARGRSVHCASRAPGTHSTACFAEQALGSGAARPVSSKESW